MDSYDSESRRIFHHFSRTQDAPLVTFIIFREVILISYQDRASVLDFSVLKIQFRYRTLGNNPFSLISVEPLSVYGLIPTTSPIARLREGREGIERGFCSLLLFDSSLFGKQVP